MVSLFGKELLYDDQKSPPILLFYLISYLYFSKQILIFQNLSLFAHFIINNYRNLK